LQRIEEDASTEITPTKCRLATGFQDP